MDMQFPKRDELTLSIKINKTMLWRWTALFFIFLFLFTQIFGLNMNLVHRLNMVKAKNDSKTTIKSTTNNGSVDDNALAAAVLPAEGVVLPIKWKNFGKQMVDLGVIDKTKMESIYASRGGLGKEETDLLYGNTNDFIKMDEQNAGFLLNLFWAFGLSNKNSILENGPMVDAQYGGAGNFASTGGWTLASGDAMAHYSKHNFVSLNAKQQALVESVSKGIYRPCCGNSVYFPDCNHGMAMLGLLELMAANGANEAQMYQTALAVNSYWFPSTYITIAKLFAKNGVNWSDVDAKTALSANYSSSAGYRQVQAQVEPATVSGGGGCGV